MSISYSGLRNYGKFTMPSVESWGQDMNILRDPPKGVYTRRIDKVGQTSEIAEMIDGSENRFAEAILPFARGVNPSVSVSYQNLTGKAAQQSAKLPYRLTDAFRPPVMTQYNLQPLSRLPRVWTSSFTKPGFADFSKKMRSCGPGDKMREVKEVSLEGKNVVPNAVYKIETPAKAPYEVKYVIQNDQVGASQRWTAPQTINHNPQQSSNWKSSAETRDGILHVEAQTALGDIARGSSEFAGQFNSEPYVSSKEYTSAHSKHSMRGDSNRNTDYTSYGALHTQNAIQASAGTNIRMPGTTRIEDLHDYSAHTKDLLHTNYESQPFMHTGKTLLSEKEMELHRSLPSHYATTNQRSNLERSIAHEYQMPLELNRPTTEAYSGKSALGDSYGQLVRGAKLTPTLSRGELESKPQMPYVDRMQSLVQNAYESDRAILSKKVSELNSRFENGGRSFPVSA